MKILKSYYELLKKDKLFLLMNASLVAILYNSIPYFYIFPYSLIGLIFACLVETICILIFVDQMQQQYKKIQDKYQAEEEQLNFWLTQMDKMALESTELRNKYIVAQKEFNNDECEKIMERGKQLQKEYEQAGTRYMLEYKKILEGYGLKVDLKKIPINQTQQPPDADYI